MSYEHGVTTSEVDTGILTAIESGTLDFVVGTGAVNMNPDREYSVNEVELVYSYTDAVELFGSTKDFDNYNINEKIYAHFSLFGYGPLAIVNVLDPEVHKEDVSDETITFTSGAATIETFGILQDTVVIKNSEGAITYEEDTDYVLSFDDDGYTVVTIVDGGAMDSAETCLAYYSNLDPSLVDEDDIIGGVDATSGAREGLELVHEVYPTHKLVPTTISCPGWSHKTSVEAVMKAKAASINGMFKAIALVDLPTDEVVKYSDASAWKSTNNFVNTYEAVFWPKVALGDYQYHLSTQAAAIMMRTFSDTDDVPCKSISNKSLQADSSVLSNGTEVKLGVDEANYLNSQGIITALNFSNGWTMWGNRTGAYPSDSDPKNSWMVQRMMFNWVSNSLILTYATKVDAPTNRRLIKTITDSVNIWLKGLTNKEYLLGGRVEFLDSENTTADLLDGKLTFHLYFATPNPAKEIEFLLELDTDYFDSIAA